MLNDVKFDESPAGPESAGLRTQALDLLAHCLSERKALPIRAFLEQQMIADPPPVQLLRDLDSNLLQQIHALNSRRFEARGRVVEAFARQVRVDVTPLMPVSELDHYQLVLPAEVLAFAANRAPVSDEQRVALVSVLERSTAIAARIQLELDFIEDIRALLTDWLSAFYSTLGRRYWSEVSPGEVTIH